MHTTHPTQIFLVDDSAPIRARLAEMIASMAGMSVVGEAANAHEAVAGILRTRPDCVLLDLRLAKSSGMGVLKAVRRRSPEIAFVVLTNQAEPQYRRACAEAGAHFFLDKTTEFDRVPEVLVAVAAARPMKESIA